MAACVCEKVKEVGSKKICAEIVLNCFFTVKSSFAQSCESLATSANRQSSSLQAEVTAGAKKSF